MFQQGNNINTNGNTKQWIMHNVDANTPSVSRLMPTFFMESLTR